MPGTGVADPHQVEQRLEPPVFSVGPVKSQKYHIAQAAQFQHIGTQQTAEVGSLCFYLFQIRRFFCNAPDGSRPVKFPVEQFFRRPLDIGKSKKYIQKDSPMSLFL